MGLAQLLLDEVYQSLIAEGIRFSHSRGEVLVGVGDTSFDRTRQRIEWVNRQDADGVVVLTPYLYPYSPEELIRYYRGLADIAQVPVYLYDLPRFVGWSVPIDVVCEVARHPNVRGIKCSGPIDYTEELRERVGEEFRIIYAQPKLVDFLLRAGKSEQLDGIFGLAPAWMSRIAQASKAGDWHEASAYQKRITGLIRLLTDYGVFPAFTALLNARGVPGMFTISPIEPLSDERREALLSEPLAQELVGASVG